MALLCCDLALYRLDQGDFPGRLEDLVPQYLSAVPGDGYPGKGFVYSVSNGGIVLYSIGSNEGDDGGKHDTDDVKLTIDLPASSVTNPGR